MTKSFSRHGSGCCLASAAAFALLTSLTSCSRQAYREHADDEVYALLDEKGAETPWDVGTRFTIDAHPNARFAVAGDPDDPLLPQPGPRLYGYGLEQLAAVIGAAEQQALGPAEPPPDGDGDGAESGDNESRDSGAHSETNADRLPAQPIPRSYWEAVPVRCLRRMLEFPSVRAAYREQIGEAPPAELGDTARRLTLRDIIAIGLVNSREYQAQKESVYLAALPLTLERFAYSARFSSSNPLAASHSVRRDDGSYSEASSVGGSLGLETMFASAGTFLARFTNELFLTYDGPDGFGRDIASELFLSFHQNLFQRDARFDPLVQSERDLVYEERTFARFRREFFVELATEYYLLLQTYRNIEIESQNYFSLVRTFEQARAEVRADVKNAPNPVAVDQFEQSMLSGRSRLVATCNRLEERLDGLKLSLGLPTETPLNIDRTELDELTDRDRVEVSAERVQRWMGHIADLRAQTRPDVEEILSSDIFLVERLLEWLRLRRDPAGTGLDPELLETLLLRLEADQARLTVERQGEESAQMADANAPPPRILVLQRSLDVAEATIVLVERQLELAGRIDRDPDAVDAARTRLMERRAELAGLEESLTDIVRDPSEERALVERAAELVRSLNELVRELDRILDTRPEGLEPAERARRILAETDRLLALAREAIGPSGAGLPALGIEVDDAMATALVQRLDLMNERGRLADHWRRIKLAADDLRSVVNFEASYRIGTEEDQALKFTAENSEARVGLSVDLPLNRREKRNSYRRSLISYHSALRSLHSLEDAIKSDVRDGLRTLRETRIQYAISVRRAALAAEQVLSVRLQLALGVPGVRGTDLIDALQSSREALIAVANARIGYLTERATFVLDLGTLRLDESGYWTGVNDNALDIEPELVFPDGAGPTYGPLPEFVQLSADIRRSLDFPPPGESQGEE